MLKSSTIHGIADKIVHIQSWTAIMGYSFKERVARINYGPYYALMGHIAQGQGGSPWSSPLRSEGSRHDSGGGGWSILSEAKSLKTNSKKTISLESTQIRRFS